MEIKKKSINLVVITKRRELEKEYKQKIEDIANSVKIINDDKQTLKNLFDWWQKNVKYDYDILSNKRESGNFKSNVYKYREMDILSSEKFAPILLNKGICKSFSEAFKDICDILNIECRVVKSRDNDVCIQSFKNLYHVWNEVTIHGETSTIDLDPNFLTFMGQRRTKPKFQIKNKKIFTVHDNQI